MHLKKFTIGILIIAMISVVLLVLFPFTKTSIENREPELKIAYIKSNINCTADITLNNGQTITLDISQKIPNCIRLYSSELSLNSKYAAFSLDTPLADEHNQVIIFS